MYVLFGLWHLHVDVIFFSAEDWEQDCLHRYSIISIISESCTCVHN